MIPIPEINLGGILPALVLCGAGLAAMIVGLFLRKRAVLVTSIISLIGIIAAFAANRPIRLLNEEAFSGLVALDAYSWFFNMVILVAVGLTQLVPDQGGALAALLPAGSGDVEIVDLEVFGDAMPFVVSAGPQDEISVIWVMEDSEDT